MKATATFKEITDIVEHKFDVRLSVCKEDERSIKVTYRKLFVSADIIVRIENMTEDEIILSYASGPGIDWMIQGAIIILRDNMPDSILINPNIHEIKVRISEIGPLQNVLDKISPENIYVEDDGLGMEFRLKKFFL